MKAFVRKTMQAAVLAATTLGASAFAAPPGPPPACSLTSDLTSITTEISCAGFSEGNLVNAGHAGDAAALLATMGVMVSGVPLDPAATVSGSTLIFSQALYGITVIGLHIGGGSDQDGHVKESTAFYTFDAGTSGIHSIDTRFDTLSNGGLYMTSPVPEPATYGMLLAGLGLMGAVARRRRS